MIAGKPSPGRWVFIAVNTVLLLALAVMTLYPFLYVIAASLSDRLFIMQNKISIIPQGFNTYAYQSVFKFPYIWTSYGNTLKYLVIGTTINMVATVFGAYPLSRGQFMGRKVFSFILVFTMWFNAGIIPMFLVVKTMKMYNTIWAMVIPSAISTYNLIVMRTFFQSQPIEMEEAALIDGCNDMQVLFRIILPLSIPVLMTITLFYMVGHWNSYMPALMYLREKRLYPLQIILRELVLENLVNDMSMETESGLPIAVESVKYATIVVATVPILCVYPFIQKYFVQGVMIGAVKG